MHAVLADDGFRLTDGWKFVLIVLVIYVVWDLGGDLIDAYKERGKRNDKIN